MDRKRRRNALFDDLERDLVATFGDLLGASPPSMLYHYTTPAGLLGIVASGHLFLSDARFLNDQSELAYGRHLVADAVSADMREMPDGPMQRVLSGVLANFEGHQGEAFCRRGSTWHLSVRTEIY